MVAHTGINLENVKANNRSAILKLLNERGAMSRKDLAHELGLTPATVTLICTELIGAGILYEQGEMVEDKRAGRKKILLGIDYTCRYVLSISIEALDTCITVSDMKGQHRTERHLKTDTETEPENFLQTIANESKVLMWEAGISREKILGVGVSIPGPVDREAGVSQKAYQIWDRPVHVTACLEQQLEFPVIVENNVKAFAEAELIYGMGRKRENLLFLKWGPGVGSAIVIDSAIYESHIAKEGEIGHIRVEKNGKRCRCGRRGCLETKASIHAIAEQVAAACTAQSMPKLYQMVEGDLTQIRARTIEQWIQADDPGMWKVIEDVIEQVANTVCSAVTLIAPDGVIVYGSVFRLPQIWERFLALCAQYDPAYDEPEIHRPV